MILRLLISSKQMQKMYFFKMGVDMTVTIFKKFSLKLIFDEKRFRSKITLITILEHITIQNIPKITDIDYKPLWFENNGYFQS